MNRLKLEFKQKVLIPDYLQTLFWDCPEKEVILEKFIKRILDYGNFEETYWLYQQYPKVTLHIAFKYPDIRRRVKFWIKLWNSKSE